jgi:hypothetical protein
VFLDRPVRRDISRIEKWSRSPSLSSSKACPATKRRRVPPAPQSVRLGSFDGPDEDPLGKCEPVCVQSEPVSSQPACKSGDWKIEVRDWTANWASGTRSGRSPISASAKAHGMRAFAPVTAKSHNSGNAWLGREDSNLRMAESKSAALPLGYAPTRRRGCLGLGGKRADNSSGFSMPQWPKARFCLKTSRRDRRPGAMSVVRWTLASQTGTLTRSRGSGPAGRRSPRHGGHGPPEPRHGARLQSSSAPYALIFATLAGANWARRYEAGPGNIGRTASLRVRLD